MDFEDISKLIGCIIELDVVSNFHNTLNPLPSHFILWPILDVLDQNATLTLTISNRRVLKYLNG